MRARLNCRLPTELRERIARVADDAGLSESEAARRLLELGLQDIEMIGTEAFEVSAAESPQSDQHAD